MRFIIATLTLLLVAGCNENQPAPDAGVTSLGNKPMPPGHPTSRSAVNNLPALPSGEITGQLELAEELKGNVKPGDPIFLIARSAATGSTLAVARLQVPEKFPLPFRLTGKNVMMAGRSLAGKVKVLARVDKDGEALSKNPGDVIGEVEGVVEVPAKDLILKLNKVL